MRIWFAVDEPDLDEKKTSRKGNWKCTFQQVEWVIYCLGRWRNEYEHAETKSLGITIKSVSDPRTDDIKLQNQQPTNITYTIQLEDYKNVLVRNKISESPYETVNVQLLRGFVRVDRLSFLSIRTDVPEQCDQNLDLRELLKVVHHILLIWAKISVQLRRRYGIDNTIDERVQR